MSFLIAWPKYLHFKMHALSEDIIMCGSRGGGGGGAGSPNPPLGFLSNTGPDPLKFLKLPSQHSMLGHHRRASETPFKWRFAGGPFMAR